MGQNDGKIGSFVLYDYSKNCEKIRFLDDDTKSSTIDDTNFYPNDFPVMSLNHDLSDDALALCLKAKE